MFTLPASLTRWILTLTGVGMSVFHLYVAQVGPPDAYVMRGLHLAFAMVLAFLMFPGFGRREPSVFDLILLIGAAAAALYPTFNLQYIQNRMYYVDDPIVLDYVFGGGLILLLLEATRRATGWALPITAIAFLAYGLTIGGQSIGIMLDQL